MWRSLLVVLVMLGLWACVPAAPEFREEDGGARSPDAAEGMDAPAASMDAAAMFMDAATPIDAGLGVARPAWLELGTVGAWAQIPGTEVTGRLSAYCGMGFREDDRLEIFSGASGGHSDNPTDNTVETLRLDVDVPAWVIRRGPSDPTGWNTDGSTGPYFPSDGRPAPRHNYWSPWWVPELGRYLIFGGRFYGTSVHDYWKTDGFDPVLDDWDPAGTYPDATGEKNVSLRDPRSGRLYATAGGLSYYDPQTRQFSMQVGYSGPAADQVQRGGSAFDTLRGHIYHLSVGNNFVPGGMINSAVVDPATGVTRAIHFQDSAAWQDFQAHKDDFLTTTTVYDPDHDRYYFYNGGVEGPEKIYRVKPSAQDTWDMDYLPTAGPPPASSAAQGGIMTKFVYVSRLKSVVLVVPRQDVYFLRLE
ncbi:MAG: hypothetical protein U1E65_22710 [Myxococcota bacterium]